MLTWGVESTAFTFHLHPGESITNDPRDDGQGWFGQLVLQSDVPASLSSKAGFGH